MFFIFRLQARYFDPVTQLPYATLQAFRVLREAYYQQLEDKGDPRNKEVAKWLAWRKEYKKSRATAQNLRPTVTPVQTLAPSTMTTTQVPSQQTKLSPSAMTSQQLIGVMQSMNNSLNVSNPSATSVTAVAHILRTSTQGTIAGFNSSLNPQVSMVSSTPNVPRVISSISPNIVINSHSNTTSGSGTVQLVQTVGGRVATAAGGQVLHRSGPQMVVVSSAGGQATSGIHLLGNGAGIGTTNLSSLSNLLVQGNTGTNLLVPGGNVQNVQIVQTGSRQGNLQVIQAASGGNVQVGLGQNVQVLQGGNRITLRPVSQTFTNLQSLLKQ